MFGMFPVKVYRSQGYIQVNTVVYVVSNDNSLITLYDTSGNMLDLYAVESGSKIMSIAVPLVSDDMFLSVLTDTDHLYILKLYINDVYAGMSQEEKNSPNKKRRTA